MLAERIGEWFEEAAQKGLERGREEGLHEGRLEGEARTLVRQLTRRFGELPGWVGERLAQASEAELERWLDAVLDAPSLAQVFAEPAEPPANH